MKNKINLLVLGSGMFTTGRGTDLFGTILPALFEAKMYEYLDDVVICSTSFESSIKAENKVKQLSKIYKKKINIFFYPNTEKRKLSLSNIVKKHKCNTSIISIPDHLHYEYTIKLLKLKLHCLVVKPMTTNKVFAKKMINLAKKK